MYYTYRNMAKRHNTEQIARAKAEKLLQQVQSLGLLLKASVVRRRFRCGKPGCRCAKGHLHQDMVVTRKADGKTQTFRVRKGRENEAIAWLENWRQFKRLLDRLTAVEIQILRMPVKDAKEHARKITQRKKAKEGKNAQHI